MNMIVCVDDRWGIGCGERLLVNIPDDKRFFREQTTGGVVLAGRKTMETLPGHKGLPGRKNLVMTHDPQYQFPDAVSVHTVEEALRELGRYEEDRQYIIGGGEIYKLFLPYCTRVYVTKVHQTFPADIFFPDLDADSAWKPVSRSECLRYEDLVYQFLTYEKNTI